MIWDDQGLELWAVIEISEQGTRRISAASDFAAIDRVFDQVIGSNSRQKPDEHRDN
jgi:hypothetical protein